MNGVLDCVIAGGGPAGLNAALVLGRARRNVVLFDEDKPRNAVTRHSHGFLTRDGVDPDDMRDIAHRDIGQYPSVQIERVTVSRITRSDSRFLVETAGGTRYETRTILLATGIKETLPPINRIHEFYGTSLFSCPYCDGWERQDEPLVVISENEHAFHMGVTLWQWTRDIAVCTNGNIVIEPEDQAKLARNGVRVYEQKIKTLDGSDGWLEKVVFEDGTEIRRTGGFVTPEWRQAADFGKSLGCGFNELGGIANDEYGRTSVKGVYSAGDASVIAPAQLIVAAAEGSRAALGINTDLTHEEFQ